MQASRSKINWCVMLALAVFVMYMFMLMLQSLVIGTILEAMVAKLE